MGDVIHCTTNADPTLFCPNLKQGQPRLEDNQPELLEAIVDVEMGRE